MLEKYRWSSFLDYAGRLQLSFGDTEYCNRIPW